MGGIGVGGNGVERVGLRWVWVKMVLRGWG